MAAINPAFLITLDSHNAQVDNNTMSFKLTRAIACQQNMDAMIRLRYFEIQHRFNNFTQYNNTLNYRITTISGTTNHTLTIAPANYASAIILAQYLNTNLIGIGCSFLLTTSQFLFNATGGTSNFSFLPSSTCLDELGFETGEITYSDLGILQSTNYVNVYGLSSIFIWINLTTQNQIAGLNAVGMLDMVPIQTDFNTMIHYSPLGLTNYNQISDKFVNTLQITLKDREQHILDITDVHMLMIVEVMYVSIAEIPDQKYMVDGLLSTADIPQDDAPHESMLKPKHK